MHHLRYCYELIFIFHEAWGCPWRYLWFFFTHSDVLLMKSFPLSSYNLWLPLGDPLSSQWTNQAVVVFVYFLFLLFSLPHRLLPDWIFDGLPSVACCSVTGCYGGTHHTHTLSSNSHLPLSITHLYSERACGVWSDCMCKLQNINAIWKNKPLKGSYNDKFIFLNLFKNEWINK